MVRVKSSVAGHKRRKRVLKRTKGQFGQKSRRYRQAIKSVIKGLSYEYRDRKVKKREFRHLWIARINAACREQGISYSRFIKGLKDAKVALDRKVLAEMAFSAPAAFKSLVKVVKDGKGKKSVDKPKAKKTTTRAKAKAE